MCTLRTGSSPAPALVPPFPPSHCRASSATIPGQPAPRWDALCRAGPYGDPPVLFAKYLGVWLAARLRRGASPCHLWCPEVLRAIDALTWDRRMLRLQARAAEIGRGPAPQAFRPCYETLAP